jgi:DNA-binding NarL/FixJ family response regulator
MARTVLVIDDSAAFRTTARMLLQARGYEVVGVAEDIASGLAEAEELRPDCVVMDVNLPDGDGLSAAGRLHGPVVVLVSTLDESAIGDVSGSGARGFVSKSELASTRLVQLLGPP